MSILMDYFIPHVGIENYKDKALFLGHMVLSLLQVFHKDVPPTDTTNSQFFISSSALVDG